MSALRVRETRPEDIPAVREIFLAAKAYMKASGNPNQWNTAYPEDCDVENDIKQGHSFVVVETVSSDRADPETSDNTESVKRNMNTSSEGRVVGYFAFIIGKDHNYAYIEDGKWLDDEKPYGTIHRIASDQSVKGVFDAAVAFAETKIDNLRVDTHADNKTMQHLAESRGFKRCGIVYMDGDPHNTRIAYQRLR